MSKNRNKESTRYWSEVMENSVAKALNGRRQPNSGAAKFNKGDVIVESASILVECKTSMEPKDSFSIKREWIEKNKKEAFEMRKSFSALAIRFAPEGENYYLINENLMKELIDFLEE